MAVKILIIFVIATIVSVLAKSNCDCNDADNKELQEYLEKLTKEFDHANEEDKGMYIAIAGILSPQLECNCLNNTRRKRHVTPRVPEPNMENIEKKKQEIQRKYNRRPVHFGSRHCPAGFVKVGILCVAEEDFFD